MQSSPLRPDDVAWARTIMTAHAQAVAAGRGVALVDGRLIENLHVAEARRVVALAEAIAEAEALYQQQTV
jgi:citrate lyase subunit beta/citryl-CoA lyase